MALCGGNSVWEGRAVLQQMAWWAGSFLSAGTVGTESCREGPWASHRDPGCSRSPGARKGFRLDVYPQPRFTLNFRGCLWINQKGAWVEIFLAPLVGLPTSKEGNTRQRRKHKANDLIPESTFLYVRLIIKNRTAKEGQATFVAITTMLTSNYIKSF